MLRTFNSVAAHIVANTPGSLGCNQVNPTVASTTTLVRDKVNVGGNSTQEAIEMLMRQEWMRRNV